MRHSVNSWKSFALGWYVPAGSRGQTSVSYTHLDVYKRQSLDEVETASELLCVCVRLAVVEKLLAEQA